MAPSDEAVTLVAPIVDFCFSERNELSVNSGQPSWGFLSFRLLSSLSVYITFASISATSIEEKKLCEISANLKEYPFKKATCSRKRLKKKIIVEKEPH
jgi:hypothetical protein